VENVNLTPAQINTPKNHMRRAVVAANIIAEAEAITSESLEESGPLSLLMFRLPAAHIRMEAGAKSQPIDRIPTNHRNVRLDAAMTITTLEQRLWTEKAAQPLRRSGIVIRSALSVC